MCFFLLNAAFAMAILDLISEEHLPSFVNMLPKYLKRVHIDVINKFSSLKYAVIGYFSGIVCKFRKSRSSSSKW